MPRSNLITKLKKNNVNIKEMLPIYNIFVR
jgi:hypothetical protein